MFPGLTRYLSKGRGVKAEIVRFEVYEVPKVIPSGRGKWVWSLVEKEGITTIDMIKEMARKAGIKAFLLDRKEKYRVRFKIKTLSQIKNILDMNATP